MNVQNILMSSFRDYFVGVFSVEPNEYNYNEWYMENLENLENENSKLNYDLTFKDIIKNMFELWMDENRIMIHDVSIFNHNKNIKNRLFLININDLNFMDQQLIFNYTHFYHYYLDPSRKINYKAMMWLHMNDIREEDCEKNLIKIYDELNMGIYI